RHHPGPRQAGLAAADGRRGGPAPHHRLVPRGSGGLTPAAAGRASGRPAERGPRGGPARLRGQQDRRRGPPAAQQVAGADAAGDDQPAGDQRAARPGQLHEQAEGGPPRPHTVPMLPQTPRTRPRSRAGGSVCSTAVPAVSETDSTTAIGSPSTSRTARDGDSPATTCSSPPAAASAPTRRTDGLRSRAPSTAPTM